MTIIKKFQADWKAAFGELELPNLHILVASHDKDENPNENDNHSDESDGSSARKVSESKASIETLELDIKATKDLIIELRGKLKSAKFCQEWLSKEVKRCRKVSEGLDIGGSEEDPIDLSEDDHAGSSLDELSGDRESLDAQSVDSAIMTEELASDKPSSESDAPIKPLRNIKDSDTCISLEPSNTTPYSSDSDGDDYEGIYENIQLLREKMQNKLKPLPPKRTFSKNGQSFGSDNTSDESPSSSPKIYPRFNNLPPQNYSIPNQVETDKSTTEAEEKESDKGTDLTSTPVLPSNTQENVKKDASSFHETNIDEIDSPIPTSTDSKEMLPSLYIRPTADQILSSPEQIKLSARGLAKDERHGAGDTQKDAPNSDKIRSRTPSSVRRLTHPEVERLNIRRAVLSGINESEKKFIGGLQELIKMMKIFRANMTLSEAELTQEEYDALFFRIPELCEVHKNFLKMLEPKLAEWTPEQIYGDCFKFLASKFDIHEEYVANYRKLSETFRRLKHENPQFQAIATELQGKLPSGETLTFEALLYSPLQRITKLTLTINDLLKHTPDWHEDYGILIYVLEKTHKFIIQITDAAKDLGTTQKKRECIKQDYLVEWHSEGRKLRVLFLWSDILICASKKPSGGMFSRDRNQYECQWYLPLMELSLIPNEKSEGEPHISQGSYPDVERIKKDLSELNKGIKKESFAKPSKQVQKDIEKKKKEAIELEAKLTLYSPRLALHLYHHSGKTYTLLMTSDYERSEWREAILCAKRECRCTPNMNMYHINKLINKFKQHSRNASVRSLLLNEEEELMTGTLHVEVKKAEGLRTPSELYCCIEVDAYGIFFLMAKTKKSVNTVNPEWNEGFDLEVDGAKTLRIICYDHTKGLEDEMFDKGQIMLNRRQLREGWENTIKMERLSINLDMKFQSPAKTLKRVQSKKKVGVFGVKIGGLVKRESSQIPTVIVQCVGEVEKRGMNELGIYRISGSAADINRLKKVFETGHRSIMKVVSNTDIHAVAGLLKLYFRELPEPLFTHELYSKFVDGLSLSDPEAKRNYMMSLLKSMPEPNRSTAFFLFNHLKKVARSESQNKMSIHNLSTVFGPTLLSPAQSKNIDINDISSGMTSMTDALSQVGVLHYYLEHFNETNIEVFAKDTRVTV